MRRKKKKLVPILYEERDYDGYGYSDEERFYPEPSRTVRERFPLPPGGGGSVIAFLGGAILTLLLVLVILRGGGLQAQTPKPQSKHFEVIRDEKGRILGIDTFYTYT